MLATCVGSHDILGVWMKSLTVGPESCSNSFTLVIATLTIRRVHPPHNAGEHGVPASCLYEGLGETYMPGVPLNIDVRRDVSLSSLAYGLVRVHGSGPPLIS